jgi:uncharacterized protein (DUF924 family)
MFATDKGKDDVATVLVHKGADINIQNKVRKFLFLQTDIQQ